MYILCTMINGIMLTVLWFALYASLFEIDVEQPICILITVIFALVAMPVMFVVLVHYSNAISIYAMLLFYGFYKLVVYFAKKNPNEKDMFDEWLNIVTIK